MRGADETLMLVVLRPPPELLNVSSRPLWTNKKLTVVSCRAPRRRPYSSSNIKAAGLPAPPHAVQSRCLLRQRPTSAKPRVTLIFHCWSFKLSEEASTWSWTTSHQTAESRTVPAEDVNIRSVFCQRSHLEQDQDLYCERVQHYRVDLLLSRRSKL